VKVVQTNSLLPYQQLMTPKWLSKHATFFGSYTVQNTYLQILAGVAQQHDFRVQLVPPGILTGDDCQCVTVKITAAMDTVLADSGDHDPIFGISDGEKFIGFIAVDKDNYIDSRPCYGVEGDSGKNVLVNSVYDNSGPRPASTEGYSSEIKIQIKPCEQWGSCHTEHNGGHVLVANYQCTLDLTN